MPPLSDIERELLRKVAEERGVDADALIAEGEAMRDGASGRSESQPSEGGSTGGAGHPTFDRMLIGAFPYVRVRELRSIWLGIEERAPDDDLFTGEWLRLHGGEHNDGGASGGGGEQDA